MRQYGGHSDVICPEPYSSAKSLFFWLSNVFIFDTRHTENMIVPIMLINKLNKENEENKLYAICADDVTMAAILPH